ncbi:ATPase [Dyella psychrodurans]|uniref:ATPase n=2 Tax=Dyella psychrodurans TaxID=1927960 RepID=A0A370X0H7_9GAMM|nr:ATPase [Dyella psychrodurans]
MLVAGLAAASAARADVVTADAAGFQIKNTLTINSTPDKVYAALSRIDQWWNPQHTFSGKSANLSLQTRAGGCFCEKLADGGSVQHMLVIYAAPGHELRLNGALGPLQTEAATGVLTLSLKAKGGATELTEIYTVSGWTKGGWGDWASGVDAVLLEQITRLKGYVETGKPVQ